MAKVSGVYRVPKDSSAGGKMVVHMECHKNGSISVDLDQTLFDHPLALAEVVKILRELADMMEAREPQLLHPEPTN